MTDELRRDLMAIVLEEAFGMREHYARKVAAGEQSPDRRFNHADREAFNAAYQITLRLDARCSRIEG